MISVFLWHIINFQILSWLEEVFLWKDKYRLVCFIELEKKSAKFIFDRQKGEAVIWFGILMKGNHYVRFNC